METCIRAMNSKEYANEVLNIGSDIEMTILELAETILDVSDSKSEIQFLDPLDEGDMTRRCPDITKMRKLLGRDLIPLKKGLKKLIAHYENRE